jgi:DNA polymerase-3 subunit epsilon
MQFVAFDFETANHRPDSPCQLAVVVVCDNRIVQERSWLIKPKSKYFSPQNIAVHGIRPSDVRGAPTWDRIWPEVQSLLDGQICVAHNAGFDMRVLSETLATYDLACPMLEYSCTRLVARRTWPGRHGYGLKPIAEFLGIQFQHHDALEDARTCARVAMAAAEHRQVQSWDDLERALSITRGRIRYGTLTGPRCIRRKRATEEEWSRSPVARYGTNGWPESAQKTRQRLAAVDRVIVTNQSNLPLAGKRVVLTGCLLGMTRLDAVQFLERLGATVQDRINLQTHFVIIGHVEGTDPADFGSQGVDSQAAESGHREQQVQQRRNQGQPIGILSQRQLLRLIPGGLEVAKALTRIW